MIDQKNAVTALDDDTQNMTVNSLSSVTTDVALFKGTYSTDFYTAVKLYSAKFSYWDAESGKYKPLRDMVPCYVKEGQNINDINDVSCAEGTIGLYDRVEGKFYANANTADGAAVFNKGEAVTELEKTLTVTLNQTTISYTGAALTPSVIVKSGETKLNEGTHYTVTYTNNTDIGTGTVEVKMSPAYGCKYVRMSFTITVPTDIYYQETDDETSRLYIRGMNGKLYMFLPATANYANLKLHLPEDAVLASGSNNFTVTSSNNGKLDMTVLFGSGMEPGKEYSLTVTANGQTYNMVLIQSANIPALYITMGGLENSSTKDKVTGGDPYIWLDDYINQSKDWKATKGSVLMVNANGTTVTVDSDKNTGPAELKSLKGRGSGSWTYGGNKKSYNIKLEEKQELVPGAGAAKNWCLISNYMTLSTHDSTGLANSTAYWLYDEIGGEAAIQYQQVDLYINGVYRGTYSLTEKVEINKKRVDITETEYKDNKEEGISTKVTDASDSAIDAGIKEYYYSSGTELDSAASDKTSGGGGFLLEVNDYYDEVCKFTTRKGVKFTLKEPEYATKEQVQQIAIYVQEFEDALFSDTGYNSKGKHYSEYVDLESLAKKLIVDAFMGNGDSMKNSGYFHIDAATSGEGSALQVNFSGKLTAGPAWDYDYWISFTDTQNLWTNNSCHGKVWMDKLLEKGDFMDILYQLNETSFKNALADGSTMLSALVEKLTPSKTMEYVLLGNDFAAKSAAAVSKYTSRLAAWNSTVWNSSRLMGVTVECTAGQLTANVNGTAASYQWYKLDENHNAAAIPGATAATYIPTAVGEYQVEVTGVSMEPLLSAEITMYSAPITLGNSNYTLTLDACGGTLPEDAAKTVTVTPGNAYPVLPTPTKAGCYFLGWFTRPQGGTQIISGSTAPAYGADCTLYARWKTTTTVQDVDDVTGVAITSDSGSVTWEHEDESASLSGLILYGSETGTVPSAKLTVPRLPAGYQEVEYIESTSGGQQWIDLGFSPSQYPNQLKSEIDLQYTVLPTGSDQGLGGAYTNGSSYYLIHGATASAFKMQSGAEKMEVTWSPSDTNQHTFMLDQQAGTANLDESSQNLSANTANVTTTVTLFKLNGTANPYYSVMRLYSARFWTAKNGEYELLRDLVPCYKTATEEAGLYDLVEGKFYANANTDSTADFIVGPDSYTARADAVTVTSPVTLYAFGDVRDSYNAVTGVVTRRVKVENGTAVAALPEVEWTAEQYTATALTQYAGLNRAAYTDSSYAAPITVVHVPASVTLSESEFTYNGSEQRPSVTVTVNGMKLTEGTDYTVTWPDDVINAGEKEVSVTINNENYNGTLVRTYTVAAPSKETTPVATFAATGPDTGTLSGVTAGMKYSTNGTDWRDINSSDDINLTGLSACTISVVKKGNGTTTVDSDAKNIPVTKAAKPAGTVTDETDYQAEDGTITISGYNSDYTYQISGDSGANWTDATVTSESKIESLAPGSYVIRVKAKDTMLASDASDPLTVAEYVRKTTKDITKFEVTVGGTAYGGTIDGTAITLTVPYGSNVSGLTPAITHNGVSISPEGAQDFRNSVEYTVTAEDGSTQVYTITITVAAPNTYTLTADAQMLHGSITSDPASPISQDAEVTLTIEPDPGYQLKAGTLKAYKSGDETSPVAITDNKLTMPGYNVIVTAEFEPIEYTITYDLADGELAEGETNPDTYTVEDVITLKNPTRSGYIFTGWTGTGLSEATKNVTIPAGSTGNRTYTATYEVVALTSIAVTTVPTKTTYTAGEIFDKTGMVVTATYSDSSTAPVTGYIVTDGENLTVDKASVTISYTEGSVTKTTTQAITVNVAPVTYTITFDPNGGDVTPTTGVAGADGKLSSLPTPTRSGSYTFNGWYTAASGGTKVTVSTVFDADTTIYAQWTYTGGSSSKYPVTAPSDVSNGTVAVSSGNAGRGTIVTITVTPDEGYRLDTLTVTDAAGNKLVLTDKGNGKYTYVMPASKVSIEATFAEIAETPDNPFVDVREKDYFHDAVQWAVDNGVTEGTTATTFSPNAACTRAQMVTFLWRAAGFPMPRGGENPFADVSADTYYYIAVLWAVENGITNGTSADAFSPDAACTRGQAITFLHRAAGIPETDETNAFADVNTDAYYANAVDWAVKQEITNGTSNNTFSPNSDCTRGQAVTFLYRAAR